MRRRTSWRRTYASCLCSRACPTSVAKSVNEDIVEHSNYIPALRTRRSASFALYVAQHTLFSQVSLPQQHLVTPSGCGEEAWLKFANAVVKSSIVAFALRRLLGESGVGGRRDMRGKLQSLPRYTRWRKQRSRLSATCIEQSAACRRRGWGQERNETTRLVPTRSGSHSG